MAQATNDGSLYTSRSEYLRAHPTWHAEDSDWKARHVLSLLRRNGITPESVCEIGCGAGAVLRAIHDELPGASLIGFEVAQDALELAAPRATDRLSFELRDVVGDPPAERFEVALLLDVVEHVEDPLALLRAVRGFAGRTVLHIPLELSVQALLRPGRLERSHDQSGHLHFFTEETALALLADSGFRVIDSEITAGAVETPRGSFKAKAARLPRRLLYRVHPPTAVRVLGGCSLLVLAE